MPLLHVGGCCSLEYLEVLRRWEVSQVRKSALFLSGMPLALSPAHSHLTEKPGNTVKARKLAQKRHFIFLVVGQRF